MIYFRGDKSLCLLGVFLEAEILGHLRITCLGPFRVAGAGQSDVGLNYLKYD